MTQARTMASIFAGALSTSMSDVWTSAPGVVVSYDESTRSVSVELPIRRAYTDESGERQTEKLPVINHVPMLFPKHYIEPVKVGDHVLVVFASQSLDRYLARGGKDVDPADPRRNSLNDAVALPGMFDFAHVPAPSIQIEVTDSSINVGGDQQFAMKSDLIALKNAITSAATGASDGGALFKTNLIAALASFPVGSQVAKGS